MNFLTSQGVKPAMLSARGFGEANPVASNDTAAGRAQNRRVELTLTAPAS
jgi:outer membrane protein OmpA-like peptidoglycan-associated protein